MEFYKDNILWLCDQRNMTLSEFEDAISIPKVRLMDPTPPELVKVADFFNYDLDTLVRKNLKQYQSIRSKEIKLIILDVDGTLTDGGMYYTENGDQIKKFHAKDGLAIRRKVAEGIKFGIISHAFKSAAISERAKLLNIEKVYTGQDKKSDILKQWCAELNLEFNQVAYVGDDINDLDILETVGLAVCPSDAVKAVKKVAHIVLRQKGGDACIREFLDEWMS